MAFCKACGQDIGTANFCPKCGANQSAAPAYPPPPAAAALTEGMAEIVVFGGLHIISIVLRFMHFFLVGFGLQAVIWLASFVLWIVLMIKAFQHEMFRVPIAADIADGMAKERSCFHGSLEKAFCRWHL